MQAVILAGGLGTRLRPLTETLPKAMVPVCGRPFLEYQLDALARSGISDVIICLGHLGHMIEDHFGDGRRFGLSIRYGYEREQLMGTTGAIKNVEQLLQDMFFVLNGDTYQAIDLAEVLHYFAARNKLGLMVVHKSEGYACQGNVVVDAGLVQAYDNRRELPGMAYVDSGIWLFRRPAFSSLPLRTRIDMSSVYQILIRRRQLLAYEACHRFYDIGTPRGLREFEALVQAGGRTFQMEAVSALGNAPRRVKHV
jgi:NDP-sugar pyrophosphorylase family protein